MLNATSVWVECHIVELKLSDVIPILLEADICYKGKLQQGLPFEN